MSTIVSIAACVYLIRLIWGAYTKRRDRKRLERTWAPGAGLLHGVKKR